MKLSPQTPFTLQVAIERSQSRGPTLPVHRPGRGFCEGCRTHRPRPDKAGKGWRCTDCKGVK
jgi:hypothetical protein